jgi:CheY-like chemotaxis protein
MSKRILVVEDQEDNRQIIRDMLTFTDYEIMEAESGEEALAVVTVQRPDLILMDIQLPGRRRIRDDAANQGRSGVAVDHDHRGHLICAQWGRTEGAGGWL